jgi:hypothetical protein
MSHGALVCPEIGVKWFLFLFLGLGTVLRCASVFGLLARLEVPSGLRAASTVYGKTPLPSGFVGTHDLTSFRFAHQTSPYQAPIVKRRRKTIFNHLRESQRAWSKTPTSHIYYLGTTQEVIESIERAIRADASC